MARRRWIELNGLYGTLFTLRSPYPEVGMARNGRFVWYDLITSDPVAAQAFYPETVGWKTQAWDSGPEPYTMWVAGETPLGGSGQLPVEAQRAGVTPFWIAYVGVADIEATVRRAQELGGRVHMPPTEIPTVGRFAHIIDPHGGRIGLLESLVDGPVPDPMMDGGVSWHELYSPDYEASWTFYSGIFPWQAATTMDMGEAGKYFIFRHAEDADEHWLGGMFSPPGPPPQWLNYVNVADLDEALARVTNRGGQVTFGPVPVPGRGRAAGCLDPQGAHIGLFSLK
jgi:predicted enzyme related to lactoylglutathione lyase